MTQEKHHLDGILDEFRLIFNQLSLSQHYDLHDKDEPIIYHYTSIGSAKKIIETGSIYATEYKNLNDPLEISEGMITILKKLEGNQNTIYGAVKIHDGKYKVNFDFNSDYFISSFCLLGDDLAQWRSYGSALTGGCAIGFDFHKLGHKLSSFDLPIIMQPVLYDNKLKEKYLNLLFTQIEIEFEKIIKNNGNKFEMDFLLDVMNCLISEFCCFTKQSGYRSEREFRVLVRAKKVENENHKIIKNRIVSGVEIPYILVDLKGKKDVIEIDELIFSPRIKELKNYNLQLEEIRNLNANLMKIKNSDIQFKW